MLRFYHCSSHALALIDSADPDALNKADWVDLLNPTLEEEHRVEQHFGIDAPTREEMQEIEISNRLYSDNGSLYMTATVIAQLNSKAPVASPITFMLTQGKLVTLRYTEPRSFTTFVARACKPNSGYNSGTLIMAGLFEVMINRQADVLEQLALDIDVLSNDVFDYDPKVDERRDFQDIMRRIGSKGIVLSKIRESLVSIARLAHFVLETIDFAKTVHGSELQSRMKALDKDVSSLLDHVTYLGSKTSFLLDATLGIISIEQNNAFRVFSILSVVLLPPTLIGAIYGMNFHHMPELDWHLGYPLSLLLMLISAIVPLAYFRRRGWL